MIKYIYNDIYIYDYIYIYINIYIYICKINLYFIYIILYI